MDNTIYEQLSGMRLDLNSILENNPSLDDKLSDLLRQASQLIGSAEDRAYDEGV